MNLKTKIITCVVVIATAFAFGRYSVQSPTVKTIIDTQTDVQKNKDKDTHTVTTIVTIKNPDGTVTETKKIDTTTETKSTENDTKSSHIDQTITPPKLSKLNISVLGGNDFSRGLLVPTYGLSINKEFIGPITIGAFGLMNGVVGVSIGLNF